MNSQRVLLPLVFLLVNACKGGGGGSSNDTTTTPPSNSSGTTGDEFLTNCPASSSLIETTEWTSCLEGKSLTGTEPFTNKACELKIKANGAFDYLRDDALAISITERSTWQSPNGTYQNANTGSTRIFLAGIAPDLPAVAGVARVTRLNISIFGTAGQQDKIEVQYLDADLARQTFNCNVSLL
ncbi:MAG TPA: hypothetical protein VFO10_15160 [Oligoflexus sp.]|uniref:hypothetical protein n=1 Tax=Oligoflexus sp. TaxID=1971216 RepID=UPI002D7E5389|nr:hypothetical protein [Oligoflexus sp.]HET9238598.1 hypothetical protein [Oligoflexus sp.]